MPVIVAMYDKSFEHIGARLDALGLDIVVHPFDRDGNFHVNGTRVPASEMAVDYLWLSSHINADGARDGVFDTVLACRGQRSCGRPDNRGRR